MRHTLENHSLYIQLINSNKPLSDMTNKELQIIRNETGDTDLFFKAEDILYKRKAIKSTILGDISKMTGGNIIIEK